MKIKSFGCSFIWGCNLPDTDYTADDTAFSKLTWPSLLSQHLGYGYQCYARMGSGNLQILEQILNADTKDAQFVIGWSWVDRFDYIDRIDNSWKTILPVARDNLAQTYYRNIHSQYCDKLTTLINIKVAIDHLKSNNVPFIMTYIDELMFDTTCQITPAITALQDYVCPHMTRFDGKDFLTWSRENGHKISKSQHPLESAHRAAANYIIAQSFS